MYIYNIDYKKSYMQLLGMHATLMKKVKKEKQLLAKVKSKYTEFIELTCFPSGLPLPNEINASTKMATAFAPGFVPVVKDAPENVDVPDILVQGPHTYTSIEPVNLSPPASPTRKRAAPLLVETPQKKMARKEPMESSVPARKNSKPKVLKTPSKRDGPKPSRRSNRLRNLNL